MNTYNFRLFVARYRAIIGLDLLRSEIERERETFLCPSLVDNRETGCASLAPSAAANSQQTRDRWIAFTLYPSRRMKTLVERHIDEANDLHGFRLSQRYI